MRATRTSFVVVQNLQTSACEDQFMTFTCRVRRHDGASKIQAMGTNPAALYNDAYSLSDMILISKLARLAAFAAALAIWTPALRALPANLHAFCPKSYGVTPLRERPVDRLSLFSLFRGDASELPMLLFCICVFRSTCVSQAWRLDWRPH